MGDFSFTKTRIAPTPSGYLHIGNAMSFQLTASLAAKAGAKLLLRIDDLDKERVRREYVEDVFKTLHFLGIEWQEGPKDYDDFTENYSQLNRIKLYEKALQQLRSGRLVFACRCSRAKLLQGECCCREKKIPLDEAGANWRLITDEVLSLQVRAMNSDTIFALLPESMMSFVVRRRDGLPAYQLSSLIDDEYFGVDGIVRGQDLWDSTLAQHYLALLLKKPFFQEVVFYHHPLVMNEEGNDKLSKSAGDTSVKFLRETGRTRQEVVSVIEGLIKEID